MHCTRRTSAATTPLAATARLAMVQDAAYHHGDPEERKVAFRDGLPSEPATALGDPVRPRRPLCATGGRPAPLCSARPRRSGGPRPQRRPPGGPGGARGCDGPAPTGAPGAPWESAASDAGPGGTGRSAGTAPTGQPEQLRQGGVLVGKQGSAQGVGREGCKHNKQFAGGQRHRPTPQVALRRREYPVSVLRHPGRSSGRVPGQRRSVAASSAPWAGGHPTATSG